MRRRWLTSIVTLSVASILVRCSSFSAAPAPNESTDARATTPLEGARDGSREAGGGGGSALGCDAAGLVAAWSFDEGDGGTASDCTGNFRFAKLTRGAGWAPGHRGAGALDIPRGGYAEVANSDGLRFAGALSVTAWTLLRERGTGRILASSSLPTDPGFELTWEQGKGPESGFLSMIIWTGSADAGDEPPGVDVDTREIPTGVWVHVASVYDGVNVRIYLNGRLEDEQTVGERRVSSQTFFIGKRGDDCCYHNGLVDELRLYNRALSDEEVSALASAP